MNKIKRFTPDKALAWTLALYPAVILALSGYMILANKPVTSDIIGLFIGLIAAGASHAAVQKKGGERANNSHSAGTGNDVRAPSGQILEPGFQSRSNDSDHRSSSDRKLCAYQVDHVSRIGARLRHLCGSSRKITSNQQV